MSSLGSDYKRQEMLAAQQAIYHQETSKFQPTVFLLVVETLQTIYPGPPAGGQGTKPGSSKDDTARKITNPPRQSEPLLRYPKGLGNSTSRSD